MEENRFQNVHAEKSLLSGVLQQTVRAADTGVEPDDFTDPFCREVFRAAQALETEGRVPDMVTLSDTHPELDLPRLMDVGTADGFSQPVCMQHASIIAACSLRRRAFRLLGDAQTELLQGKDPSGVLCGVKENTDRLLEKGGDGETVLMSEIAEKELDRLVKGDAVPTVSSGIETLDHCLGGGFEPSGMITIGSRPSVGKSAFLSFIALNAAGNAGLHCLYVSMEMSEQQNARRMMAAGSGVAMGRIAENDPPLGAVELGKISDGIRAFHMEKIHHVSCSYCRVSDIRRMAVALKSRGKLDAVFIDYLTLLAPEHESGNRVTDVGQISRSLKLLAQELKVPVITAAQLSRAYTEKRDERPQLQDLRESGSIEQDSNVVLFLFEAAGRNRQKEDAFLEKRGIRPLRIAVAKNRQGPAHNEIATYFHTDTMSFTLKEEEKGA